MPSKARKTLIILMNTALAEERFITLFKECTTVFINIYPRLNFTLFFQLLLTESISQI